MTTTFSDNLETRIINELMFAQQSIKIAVAWFNSKNILNVLCWKLKGGNKVEIIMHYDEINTGSDYSLDFTEYKRLGGILIWAKSEKSTMHVKFCIIDEKVLLHGSCNWTSRAFKKNDEVLNMTTDEPEMINSYLANFASLKEKYTSSPTPLKGKAFSPYNKRKGLSKGERIKLFVEEMERYTLQQYSTDYIKSFLDYWTGYSNNYIKYFLDTYIGNSNSLKMRFEEKADFVMMLELEDWGNKITEIKENEEYERFCKTAEGEALEAYDVYCKSINECSSWPDFSDRLKEMHDDFEAKAELFRQTKMKDILLQWKGESCTTVYDWLIRHYLPKIRTESVQSGLVQYCLQSGVYSCHKKEPFINDGLPHSKSSHWGWRIEGHSVLLTIKELENYFGCTFLEYCQVPARRMLTPFESFSRKYVNSCVFNSRFKYKLHNESNLTKDMVNHLFETSYAIESYNKKMQDYNIKYGDIPLNAILKEAEIPTQVGNVKLKTYLLNCFFDIRLKNHDPWENNHMDLEYRTLSSCDGDNYPNIIIPKINEALGIQIEYFEGAYTVSKKWCKLYSFTLPYELYYAREGFKFLPLKEACGFNEEKTKLKPLIWYYKEIMSWDKLGISIL